MHRSERSLALPVAAKVNDAMMSYGQSAASLMTKMRASSKVSTLTGIASQCSAAYGNSKQLSELAVPTDGLIAAACASSRIEADGSAEGIASASGAPSSASLPAEVSGGTMNKGTALLGAPDSATPSSKDSISAYTSWTLPQHLTHRTSTMPATPGPPFTD